MLSLEGVKCKVNGFITTIKNKLQEVYFFLIADSLLMITHSIFVDKGKLFSKRKQRITVSEKRFIFRHEKI